jgi:5-methylcytosine-specific restriction endonuclease McrA
MAQCKECCSKYQREYYLKNLERVSARLKNYREQNREKVSACIKQWREREKEHIRQQKMEYRSRPEVAARELQRAAQYYAARKEDIQRRRKERLLANEQVQQAYREYQRVWVAENKHMVRAKVARRRARKLQSMPAWADKAEIASFYALAAHLTKTTGVKHEVDHIVPLRGENVSGLHVQNNLQVLSRTDNRIKANRFAG